MSERHGNRSGTTPVHVTVPRRAVPRWCRSALVATAALGLFACSQGGGQPTTAAPKAPASSQRARANAPAAQSGPFSHVPAATRAMLAKAKPATAPHAMVSTAQHLATMVGVDILRQGGNAIDAAVAIGFAQAVVNPCCGNIGGGGFMTIHLKDGKNVFLNFREKAPRKATPTMFQDASGNVVKGRSLYTFLSVGVPGTVMGLDTALKKYGTMSLQQVVQPAIELARKGFVLDQGDTNRLQSHTKEFRKRPNAAAIFLNHGKPWQPGQRLVQTQLAHTLELIAKNGPKAFYDGPIAKAIVKASDKHGGILQMKDFENYTAEWKQPVTCQYHGYTIVSAAPPSSGGTTLCMILEILKPYPLAKWGFGSTKTVHYLAEAMRRAFANRNTYLGDPDFVHNPIKKLLSTGIIKKLRSSIRPDQATPSSQVQGVLGPYEGNHTTHYDVMDAQGNAVAVTYTINYLFGSGYIAGNTGFFLNDEMDDFTEKPGTPNGAGLVQGLADQVEAGKRPLSSMTPTIVLHNDKPFMLTGSPGSATIITTTMHTILNVVDFGMNMQQAVDAPRLHQQWLPQVVYVEPGLLTQQTRAALTAMGYTLKPRQSIGVAESILVNSKTGMLEGASDPRRPGSLSAGY